MLRSAQKCLTKGSTYFVQSPNEAILVQVYSKLRQVSQFIVSKTPRKCHRPPSFPVYFEQYLEHSLLDRSYSGYNVLFASQHP